MTLTLDEITYLYELALNDNPPNMIFSNEKKYRDDDRTVC